MEEEEMMMAERVWRQFDSLNPGVNQEREINLQRINEIRMCVRRVG